MNAAKRLPLWFLLLSACGASAQSGGSRGASMHLAPAPTGAPGAPSATVAMDAAAEESAEAPPAAPAEGAALAAPAVAPSPAPPERSGGAALAHEMLDIEARAQIVVPDAVRAAAALRALTARHGGFVTSENVEAYGEGAAANLTLRVPVGESDRFLAALRGLGKVVVESVQARDIGKEFFDASVALSNLEATLARYQQILEKAQNVREVLEIEAQLSRIRGEIESVKGNLRFMKDRAARATVHVALREDAPQIAAADEPEALIHPGVRVAYLLDVRADEEIGYYGGGVSLRHSPALGVDLDVLRRVDSDARVADGLLVTAGGNLYSDFLGKGERRFLNPFLGYRLGYARLSGEEDAFAFGAALGLELYKTRMWSVGTAARGLGLYGGDGLHFGFSPELTLDVAF